MFDLNLSLGGDIAVFVVSAIVITFAGIKMAGLADRLADRTGMGEALTGTVFLGLMTALPGLTASVTAAVQGHPVLAISNAIGGIAFQTVILAVGDIVYRKANLEHAAASIENILQTTMLVLLLTLVTMGISSPNWTIGHIHPITILLILAAGMAFWLVARICEAPMWRPQQTDETVNDEPEEGSKNENLKMLLAGLIGLGVVSMVAGSLVAESAGNLIEETILPEAIIGGLLMAVATSMPELVTCVAAVRRGALTLSVSNIVGGNFFDVLFVAAADLVYLKGSLFHSDDVGLRETFICGFTILLNVLLLAGLIYRQKHGPGNIGFESMLMLITYLAGYLVLATMG